MNKLKRHLLRWLVKDLTVEDINLCAMDDYNWKIWQAYPSRRVPSVPVDGPAERLLFVAAIKAALK
jgi:hypothetical protein